MNKATLVLLTYAKAFFASGTQARRNNTGLGNMQAILHLHDAVEFCLRAVLEEFAIPDSSHEFKGTVKAINTFFATGESPKKLPFQNPMEFLNTTRGKVKHHASIPSREDTERCELNAYSFLQAVCEQFFALSFDALSQADLIENQSVRSLLKDSERLADEGDLKGALVSIKKAWVIAMPSTSTFIDSTDGHAGFRSMFHMDTADETRALQDRIKSLEKSVALVMMGVDPLRLQRFEDTTPEVISGVNETNLLPSAIPPTSSMLRENRDFAVEMILKWQEMGIVGSRRSYDDENLSTDEILSAELMEIDEETL